MRRYQISPSILNCRIGHLHEELQRIANADNVHVDVMDNHFVPNLSWGLPIVEACMEENLTLPVDVHLMIDDPDRWAIEYARTGAHSVTFHVEAARAPFRLADALHEQGAKVGAALRPSTPVESYFPLLKYIDTLLVMTVEPGFGGQKFLSAMLKKIETAYHEIHRHDYDVSIQVDGGINIDTVGQAAQAGANIFVAGSAIFCSDNPGQEIQKFREKLASSIRDHDVNS